MLLAGLLMAGAGVMGSALLAAAAVCLHSGCSSLSFYAQAASGHLDLMRRARAVTAITDDPATPATLRERLQLSQRIRSFASAELGLPDNDSYRRYGDLQRPAVVWNVVAAAPLSLALKTWCFPVMGCVGYRGYFELSDAQALSTELQADALEVSVYGVPAYSTLGWSNWVGGDPLLNTFIAWPEGELARLIFHELAHQVAYAADDTAFNESFAVAVERLGGRRWLERHASATARDEFARIERRREDFRAFTQRWRSALQTLYASDLTDAVKLERKATLMAAMRADYARVKTEQWDGFAGYDGWISRANNASFGVMAAYNELVPEFERLFAFSGSDFGRFYERVRTLAALPKAERRRALAAATAP